MIFVTSLSLFKVIKVNADTVLNQKQQVKIIPWNLTLLSENICWLRERVGKKTAKFVMTAMTTSLNKRDSHLILVRIRPFGELKIFSAISLMETDKINLNWCSVVNVIKNIHFRSESNRGIFFSNHLNFLIEKSLKNTVPLSQCKFCAYLAGCGCRILLYLVCRNCKGKTLVGWHSKEISWIDINFSPVCHFRIRKKATWSNSTGTQ